MSYRLAWIISAVACGAAAAAAANAVPAASPTPMVASAETTNATGAGVVVIENDLYRLAFDPARGGRCSSFVVKATGREWVYDGEWAGLFLDHFAHQPWPGELLAASYQHALDRDATSVRLRLWTTATRDPLTEGLVVGKEVTLRAGQRQIELVNTFSNATAAGKNVALWVQQCFCYGGDRLYDVYYRPSSSGVRWVGMDDCGEAKIPPGGDDYAKDWVKDPVAGWTAGRDRRTSEGAVFLLDANYLNILYNCANSYTTEWFMDKVPIPAGKSWSTRYAIVPVDGFTAFAHAGERVIANVEATPETQAVCIRHQVAGTTGALGRVTIATRVYGVRSQRVDDLPPLSVEGVGLAPVAATQTWSRTQTEPILLRITLAGPDWTEHYEYLAEGAFASQGIQGAGSVAEYIVPRVPKVKRFLKPEVWSRPRNAHPRTLLLYGLYSQHYRVEEAVKALDAEAAVKRFDGWDFFPPTYEELLGYDLLVLSDVPAGPDYANEMVADFVRHGGGLLVLGGMLTYGAGQWRGTTLESILPVAMPEGFDCRWLPGGARPHVLSDHPAVRGIRWPDDARFYWIHAGVPKPDANVVLAADGQPILVVGHCGDGRIAAVLATCHGEPKRRQVEAWTTPEWTRLLSQTMQWLKEGK